MPVHLPLFSFIFRHLFSSSFIFCHLPLFFLIFLYFTVNFLHLLHLLYFPSFRHPGWQVRRLQQATTGTERGAAGAKDDRWYVHNVHVLTCRFVRVRVGMSCVCMCMYVFLLPVHCRVLRVCCLCSVCGSVVRVLCVCCPCTVSVVRALCLYLTVSLCVVCVLCLCVSFLSLPI